MNEVAVRMTEADEAPDAKAVSVYLGRAAYQRWARLTGFIEASYPGIFAPEWLFFGAKYGWALRYRKSKSFCTLIPGRKQFAVQIVFGREEREKAETVLRELSTAVRDAYRKARTFHDGKWLLLAVDRDEILSDIGKLLAVKRRPKGPSKSKAPA